MQVPKLYQISRDIEVLLCKQSRVSPSCVNDTSQCVQGLQTQQLSVWDSRALQEGMIPCT